MARRRCAMLATSLLAFSLLHSAHGSGLNCTCGDAASDDALVSWREAHDAGDRWRYICCCAHRSSGGVGNCCIGDAFDDMDDLLSKTRGDNEEQVQLVENCFIATHLDQLQWGNPEGNWFPRFLIQGRSADDFFWGYATEDIGSWGYVVGIISLILCCCLSASFLSSGCFALFATGKGARHRQDAPPLALLRVMRPALKPWSHIPRKERNKLSADLHGRSGQVRNPHQMAHSPIDRMHETEYEKMHREDDDWGGRWGKQKRVQTTMEPGNMVMCGVCSCCVSISCLMIVVGIILVTLLLRRAGTITSYGSDLLRTLHLWWIKDVLIVLLFLVALAIFVYWIMWFVPLCAKCCHCCLHMGPLRRHCTGHHEEVRRDAHERNPLLTGFNKVFPIEEDEHTHARADDHLTPKIRRRIHGRDHEQDSGKMLIDILWCCAGQCACCYTVLIMVFAVLLIVLIYRTNHGFKVYDEILWDVGYPDQYHGMPSPGWILVLVLMFATLAAFLLVLPFLLKYQVFPKWVGGKSDDHNARKLTGQELQEDPFYGKEVHHDLLGRGQVSAVYESHFPHQGFSGRTYECQYKDDSEHVSLDQLKKIVENRNDLRTANTVVHQGPSSKDKFWSVRTNMTSVVASCCVIALGAAMITMFLVGSAASDAAHPWAIQASNEICHNWTTLTASSPYQFCASALAQTKLTQAVRLLRQDAEVSCKLARPSVIGDISIICDSDWSIGSSYEGESVIIGQGTPEQEENEIASTNGSMMILRSSLSKDHSAGVAVAIASPTIYGTEPARRMGTCSSYTATPSLCDWTRRWSCPGQVPAGTEGQAKSDNSVGFTCCCTQEGWKSLPAVSTAVTTTAPVTATTGAATTGAAVSTAPVSTTKVYYELNSALKTAASTGSTSLDIAVDSLSSGRVGQGVIIATGSPTVESNEIAGVDGSIMTLKYQLKYDHPIGTAIKSTKTYVAILTTTTTTSTSTTTTSTTSTTSTTTTTTTWYPTPTFWRDIGGPHPGARAFVLDVSGTETMYPSSPAIQKASTTTQKPSALRRRLSIPVGGDCSMVADLCGTAAPGWNAATSCACSGESAQASHGMEGGYCKHWMTGDPSYSGNLYPWCFVKQTAVCGTTVNEAYNGKFRSQGPCGASSLVQAYSERLLTGKQSYLNILEWALLLGSVAILTALAALCYVVTEGLKVHLTAEDQFYALPCEDQFRWAAFEAPKILNDEVPTQQKHMIYGLYNQAKYGNAKDKPPDKSSNLDYEWWDKWRSLQGLPSDEAMKLYTDMILEVGHYRLPHEHLGCWKCCGDDCLFQLCGCSPIRKDFGISRSPGLPEWLRNCLHEGEENE